MDSIRLTRGGSRRGLAVGVWSLQLISLTLSTADLSLWVGICLALVISIASTGALLLVEEERQSDRLAPVFLPNVAVAVALLIPLIWSLRLSEHDSPLVRTLLALVSTAGPGMTAIIRWTSLARPRQHLRTPLHVKMEPCSPHFDLKVASESTSETLSEEQIFVQNDFEDIADVRSRESPAPTVSAGAFSQDVTQWLTRSRIGKGEQISGGVRVEFAPGERDTIVHLSFCPAFLGIPDIVTEDLDGAGLEIRVAAVFPFGARLSIRQNGGGGLKSTQNAGSSYCVGFTASAKPVRRVA